MPKYPHELREQGVEGRVLVQFVLDTTGRADMRTFELRDDVRHPRPDPRFVTAVRSALPAMVYRPAVRDGRRVRQLVQQPFAFGLMPMSRWGR